MIELAIDLLLIFLLALTTTWCVLLYRRLARLRVERRDIEAFVTAIDTASQRAEAAIAGIRDSALDAQRALAGQKELAQQRVAELSRLIDSAGRMARRVETALHQGARSMAESGLARDRPDSVEHAPPVSPAGGSATRQGLRGPDERAAAPKIDTDLLRALEALR